MGQALYLFKKKHLIRPGRIKLMPDYEESSRECFATRRPSCSSIGSKINILTIGMHPYIGSLKSTGC